MNTYAHIKIENIMFDPTYHRAVNYHQVKELTETFDEALLHPIPVSKRNGRYFVLDGLQQATAAKKTGRTTLYCQIYKDLTVKQESDLYQRMNKDRKRLTLRHVHIAQVAQEAPGAMQLQRYFEEAGIRPSNLSVLQKHMKISPKAVRDTLMMCAELGHATSMFMKAFLYMHTTMKLDFMANRDLHTRILKLGETKLEEAMLDAFDRFMDADGNVYAYGLLTLVNKNQKIKYPLPF